MWCRILLIGFSVAYAFAPACERCPLSASQMRIRLSAAWVAICFDVDWLDVDWLVCASLSVVVKSMSSYSNEVVMIWSVVSVIMAVVIHVFCLFANHVNI